MPIARSLLYIWACVLQKRIRLYTESINSEVVFMMAKTECVKQHQSDNAGEVSRANFSFRHRVAIDECTHTTHIHIHLHGSAHYCMYHIHAHTKHISNICQTMVVIMAFSAHF